MFKIFQAIYLFIFSWFIKKFYLEVNMEHLASSKEDLYYNSLAVNKLVVFVKDENIGKNLYQVLPFLCRKKVLFATKNDIFEIDKCISEANVVKCFRIHFKYFGVFSGLSKYFRLRGRANIAIKMQKIGFDLDINRVEDTECRCISEFFSCFVPQKEEESMASNIIEYIHYIYSEKRNFDEYYDGANGSKLFLTSEVPYSLQLAKMFYQYKKTNSIPVNMDTVLLNEAQSLGTKRLAENALIIFDETFKSKLDITEETREYRVYDGYIKIFYDMPQSLMQLLINKEFINSFVKEKVKMVVYNVNGEILGYTFEKQNNQLSDVYVLDYLNGYKCTNDWYSIFDYNFNSQSEIFMIFKELIQLYKLCRTKVKCLGETEADFESNLFLEKENSSEIIFKFKTIFDLYKIGKEDSFQKKIIDIFFKVFLKYINQKYGEIKDKNRLLEIKELRFISPILAREFINFALGKNVDYKCVASQSYTFVENNKYSDSLKLYYDARFDYDPFDKPFLFEHEAKEKYGNDLIKGSCTVLDDGRRVIIFRHNQRSIALKEQNLYKEINSTMKLFTNNHIRPFGVSEVIYSEEIDSSGMYYIVGYVTKPVKGECLENILLNLNNKELCYIYGMLLVKFKTYNIPLEHIWIDNNGKDSVFYIDTLSEDFWIIRNDDYLKKLLPNMIENGYNPNAIESINITKSNVEKLVCNWIDTANSWDSYCDEHGIYFAGADKICPICSKTKYFLPEDYEKTYQKVFEDEYAVHYVRVRNNLAYNVKVYKVSCDNLAKIEENIDSIITGAFEKSDFHQEDFIPCKKAMDSNGNFVGYMYEHFYLYSDNDKKELCADICDKKFIETLSRIRCLIRLITQVKELTSENFGFFENPFTNVFLNTNHKRQVQIPNIEFLCSGNTENTHIWLYNYICHVLEDDSSIEVDISNCNGNIDDILVALKNLMPKLTKRCSLHRINYKQSYIFCPKCIDAEKVSRPNFEKLAINWFDDKTAEAEGGESNIYAYGENQIAKVFKLDEINYDSKSRIMQRITEKSSILDECNKENHKFKYVFHKKFLLDPQSNQIFGCIMDKVENAYPIYGLRDKIYVKKFGFTLKDILEILITVAEGIETLHKRANIFIGDLNSGNILFDSDKNVYFIDFDGMGVDEFSPDFSTDGYIDPISQKNHNITMKDDWYSFAIHAFYYLTYTHPFRGMYYTPKDGNNAESEVERMEKRISLLGPHGLKPTNIANDWDWMTNDLKKAFLEIFEKDLRENIWKYLKEQYDLLFSDDEDYKYANSFSRINDKFIAKKMNYFGENVIRVFNEHIAIIEDEDGDKCYQIFFKDEECMPPKYLSNIDRPQKIVVTEDEQYMFVICDSRAYIINLHEDSNPYTVEIYNHDANNVVVDGNCLYAIWNEQDGAILKKYKFTPNKFEPEIESTKLHNKVAICLNTRYENKFVFVFRADDRGNVDIYCNEGFLCQIKCSRPNAKYNIVSDEMSGSSWLVVNSLGNAILINSKQEEEKYKSIDFSKYVNETNVSNIYFKNGNIFIPNENCLYIYMTESQTVKELVCPKIMTSESKLFDYNSNGFGVITGNAIYKVCRG